MTDPVDTDALRARVNLDANDDFDFGQKVILLQRTVKAAADEVDRLRAVLENAPHADDCTADQVLGRYEGEYVYADCTCWKADAL